MAMLSIRNLPDHVHTRLRIRAAKAGRSMEAEARDILTASVMEAPTDEDRLAFTLALPDWVDELYGGKKPTNVVDELIAERRLEAEREWSS